MKRKGLSEINKMDLEDLVRLQITQVKTMLWGWNKHVP